MAEEIENTKTEIDAEDQIPAHKLTAGGKKIFEELILPNYYMTLSVENLLPLFEKHWFQLFCSFDKAVWDTREEARKEMVILAPMIKEFGRNDDRLS